jgi:cytosine/adenosine deaminase-related metal-dependent hydrolase
MLDQGVKVGLGVDGSASNDGNHLLGEARQALLLQRVGWPAESHAHRLSVREALGGDRGRREGAGAGRYSSLEPGKAGDLWRFASTTSSMPALSVIRWPRCSPVLGRAWLSIINGRVVVVRGMLVDVEPEPLVARHNALSRRMMEQGGLMKPRERIAGINQIQIKHGCCSA